MPTMFFTLIALSLMAADVSASRMGFMLTAPKILQSNSTEKLCITFHEISFDLTVTVMLENSPAITEELFESGKGGCFDFHVPYMTVDEDSLSVIVEQYGTVPPDQTPYKANATQKVKINRMNLMTFIQTDKPIYKPGDRVKFRILSVDSNLKPRLGEIPKIYVQDPSGVRVAQWLEVETQKGLGSLELALSKEPALGDWKITAEIDKKKEEQTFEVKEYVLPKYEVKIKPPSFVRVDDKEIKGEICAHYTYGKPVKGELVAEFCVKIRYTSSVRPCAILVDEINGCQPFTIQASTLKLTNSTYSIYDAKLQVVARVTEEATGVILNETNDDAKIETTPFKIEIRKHSPDTYKPGLKYHGKIVVKKPDGAPAPGELIQVGIDSWQSEKDFRQNYTSDKNGEIFFTMPPFEKQLPSIKIVASAPDYPYYYDRQVHQVYAQQAYHSIQQWYSPTGRFMQIEPIREVVKCGSTLKVNVTYTTEANTELKFYYEILSRGNILESGHKRHHFKIHDYMEPLNDEPVGEDLVEMEGEIAPGFEGMEGAEEPEVPVVEEEIIPEIAIPYGDDMMTGPPIPPTMSVPTTSKPNQPNQVELPGHVSAVHFEFPVTPQMSPLTRILIYYVREDGEVVSDSTEVKVQHCWDNKVELGFSDEERLPGEDTTLELKASPQSLCAIGAVDKSVHLLRSSNQLDSGKIFELLKGYDININNGGDGSSDYCEKKRRFEEKESPSRLLMDAPRPPSPFWSLPGPPGERRKRSIAPWFFPQSEYYDAIRAFQTAGMVVLTDLTVETRPCSSYRPYPAIYWRGLGGPLAVPRASGIRQFSPPVALPMIVEADDIKEPTKTVTSTVTLRNYFPETWLWELEYVGESGKLEKKQTMPHTVTEWVGSAFCTNTETGLGVASPATIKTFQPFFVSFNLPYSVIRKEKVPLKLSVFNYLEECLTIQLTLKNSPSFVVFGEKTAKLCVCGNEVKTHTYKIVATKLGNINITVKAVSTDEAGVCGNNVQMSSKYIDVQDAVERQLLVEAEGAEEEYTYSSFFCPKDAPFSDEVDLTLPKNLVPDSARARVTLTGDLMGPSLTGLDSLVKMPYGCGEQNMVGFVPNIVVMQYLSSTNQLTHEIETKAKEYMKAGYQRELNYKHADGSYSAFGKNDKSGSTWLTAFVLKSFAQARKYIFIDEKELEQTIGWLRQQQMNNGCFRKVGKLFSKSMAGGVESSTDPTTSLSAYVLMALLETGLEKTDPSIQGALHCLENRDITDTYTVAIMAYAYTLYYNDDLDNPLRQNFMKKLHSKKIEESGMVQWNREKAPAKPPNDDGWFSPFWQAQSTEVEMTAYALMAYSVGGQTDNIGFSLQIVRWLSQQRNAYGGFSSTQDTVVAIQALAAYAKLTYSPDSVVYADVQGNDFRKIFFVNDVNSLVQQDSPVPSLPNKLTINANGTGCALMQANVRYNVYEVPVKVPVFDLDVNVMRKPGACKRRILSACVTYNGQDEESNMVVMEVRMISGWIPDKKSLKEMKNQFSHTLLKRYEVDKDAVAFYFDYLSRGVKQCVRFQVEQYQEIEKTKVRPVKVYDYYEKDESKTVFYNIRRTCGTKEDLPVLTVEEYEKESKENPFVQRRLPNPAPPFRPEAARLFSLVEDVRAAESRVDKPTCPACSISQAVSVMKMFCNHEKAYKIRIRNSDKYPLKIKADLRPVVKERLDIFATYNMTRSDCYCPLLKEKHGTRLLILASGEQLSRDGEINGHLVLDGRSVVLHLTHDLEKKLYRAKKRLDCK